jgi:hypothetical protein
MELLFRYVGWLPAVGAAAVVAVALLKVRAVSERAALAMAAGAGLALAFRVVHFFVQHELLWVLDPLVYVGSVGAVVYGLMLLVDAANPKTARGLPATLAALKVERPNTFVRGFFGFFGLAGIFTGLGGRDPLVLVAGAVALVATLVGSWWVGAQGPLWRWVLERRPDQVLWAYVHQLTVHNRRAGTTSVHWSAQLGLASGARIGIPALGDSHAQQLVVSVLELRPGILVGFSPETRAKFDQLVAAAKRSAVSPGAGPGAAGPGGGITTL